MEEPVGMKANLALARQTTDFSTVAKHAKGVPKAKAGGFKRPAAAGGVANARPSKKTVVSQEDDIPENVGEEGEAINTTARMGEDVKRNRFHIKEKAVQQVQISYWNEQGPKRDNMLSREQAEKIMKTMFRAYKKGDMDKAA